MARALTGFLWLMLLAGCAQLPPATHDGAGFELSGRVAVRHAKESGTQPGTESATGRVQWRHSPGTDDLLITNPLGQGVARIVRRADGVTLETADGRVHRASDAESLTQQVLGWRLPLAGLPDWVQGRPREGAPADIQPGEAGKPFSLRQDGWLVEYEEYRGAQPSLLRLAHPDVANPRVVIRLVVESMAALP